MKTAKKVDTKSAEYKRQRVRQSAELNRQKSFDRRNIVIAPYAKSPERIAAESSLMTFIETYLPARFALEMSADQREAIARMETAVLSGGQFAQACPRGDGKTERAIAACLWAWLSGHRRYIVIIGADLGQAKQILSEIFHEIGDNDDIARDWPEISACIRGMDGNANAARYLILNGQPARFVGGKNKLVYPTCGEKVGHGLSGNVIEARGLTGSLRGMRHTPKGGTTIRPDLAIIDDPQTDESAKSFDQVATREALINGAIIGMAGPRKKIAAICNCTVIRRQDLADRLLDQKKHPEWRGVRFKMLYDWPKRKDLWNEYIEIRRDGMRNGAGGHNATEFYQRHREAMDAGVKVGWMHRYREGELSAIQCVYNIIADHGDDMFQAEYQNEPRENRVGLWRLMPEQVVGNLTKLKRGVVPESADCVTIGMDVNITRGINWVVMAWTGNAAGAVIDYGRFPGGDSPLWSDKSPYTEDQAVQLGVSTVMDELLFNRKFVRDVSGEIVRPSSLAVDCGFHPSRVFMAVKLARAKYGGVEIFPIRGVGGKYYRVRDAISKGDRWHVSQWGQGNDKAATLFFNADTWRERVQRGFLLPVFCPGGSIGVWGNDAGQHQTYAENITAERIIDVLHGDRLSMVYVWHLEPGRANDLLDASVYAMVAASRCHIKFGQTVEDYERTAATRKIEPGLPEKDVAESKPTDAKPVVKPIVRHHPPRRRGGFVNGWK